MDSLEFTERPELRRKIMLTAFAGWPDASEAATRAIRYLADQLSATKFASIDPEEFYNFVEQRPKVRNGADGERILSWPENQFYSWRNLYNRYWRRRSWKHCWFRFFHVRKSFDNSNINWWSYWWNKK